jgi:hypothetical protein
MKEKFAISAAPMAMRTARSTSATRIPNVRTAAGAAKYCVPKSHPATTPNTTPKAVATPT